MGKAWARRISEIDTDVPFAKAAHRDAPPVDVIYRGRSPGSRVIIGVRLPEASSSVTYWTTTHRLQLRGQLRHGCHKASSPNSLLTPDLTIRRTTIRFTMAAKDAMVNHIKRSLCGASFPRSYYTESDRLLSANNVRRLDGRDGGAKR